MSAAAARPLVSVHQLTKDAKKENVTVPAVLLAPIRPDIVHFVHTNMAKNHRQPYATFDRAGMGHSAESWGTGRAVARIPRVSGGGTSRAGQGAFGNMCRKGRMYSATKIWRKWHRKINTNQKRFAVASALAASAIPALVMGRGHAIEKVPEVPLVVDASVESIQKTRDAVAALKALNAYDDVEKAKNSKKLRAGVGKMRNRRHTMRRGPLIVYSEDNGISKAFRNLPGVEIASVERLNLLQLAPGGHLGRFIIWTRSAFEKLNAIFGSVTRASTQKKGYTLPRNIMVNSDITRIINSDEIQTKVRPAIKTVRRSTQKKNPLKNLGAMVKLNPYALNLRRAELLAQERRAAIKAGKLQLTRHEVRAQQKAAAAQRTHEPQQKLNYARIANDDFKAPENYPLQLAVHKPREKMASAPKDFKPEVTKPTLVRPTKVVREDKTPKKERKSLVKKAAGGAAAEDVEEAGPTFTKRAIKVRVISVGKAGKAEGKKGGKAEAKKAKK